MNEQTLSRIAVIILAIVLIVFGIYHFMQPRVMFQYVPNFLPGGRVWVYVVGIAFILAGIAFILHRWVKLAGYLLSILLICFVLFIHLPNYMHSGDVNEQRDTLMNLLKDSAIAAFALYIASNAQKI